MLRRFKALTGWDRAKHSDYWFSGSFILMNGFLTYNLNQYTNNFRQGEASFLILALSLFILFCPKITENHQTKIKKDAHLKTSAILLITTVVISSIGAVICAATLSSQSLEQLDYVFLSKQLSWIYYFFVNFLFLLFYHLIWMIISHITRTTHEKNLSSELIFMLILFQTLHDTFSAIPSAYIHRHTVTNGAPVEARIVLLENNLNNDGATFYIINYKELGLSRGHITIMAPVTALPLKSGKAYEVHAMKGLFNDLIFPKSALQHPLDLGLSSHFVSDQDIKMPVAPISL